MNKPPSQPADTPDQAEGGPKPRPGDYDELDFKQRLSDEYKILQDKIDKIGAFRFTVKGWSITAVVAAIATTSEKGFATVCIVSFGLAGILLLFFFLEYEQVRQSRLFGDRARRLEQTLMRIRRGKGAELYKTFHAPYTAHELVLASLRQKAGHRGPHTLTSKQLSIIRQERRSAIKQSDVRFYASLTVLALTPLLLQHHAIGTHWRDFTQGVAHVTSSLLLALSNIWSRLFERVSHG